MANSIAVQSREQYNIRIRFTSPKRDAKCGRNYGVCRFLALQSSDLRNAAPAHGCIFIIEHVVPGPETPYFSKLFDIHMMCWGTGRERTAAEYARLLETAGWRYKGVRPTPGGLMAVVEGQKTET